MSTLLGFVLHCTMYSVPLPSFRFGVGWAGFCQNQKLAANLCASARFFSSKQVIGAIKGCGTLFRVLRAMSRTPRDHPPRPGPLFRPATRSGHR